MASRPIRAANDLQPLILNKIAVSLFSGWQSSANKFLTSGEHERVVEAIRLAEMQTSGEIRVFIESRCRYAQAMDRAAELFFGLQMDHTEQRNGVLVYVAFRDHQFALFADQGIYQEMGAAYWEAEAAKMVQAFKRESYADGLVTIIGDIGEALRERFPYHGHIDKNELPDDIVFGH
jgi:uncharacterized membrane protein